MCISQRVFVLNGLPLPSSCTIAILYCRVSPPDDIDLVLESVSIGDGCCTEDLIAGDTTTYHFTYAIVKGQAPDPAQIKYKAFISLDRDLNSSTTHMITHGEQTWNTSSGTTASCKYYMCLFKCVIMSLCSCDLCQESF